MYTYTVTVSGTTYTATSTGTPECHECMGRIYAHSRRDRADERTAADWQQAQAARAERNQAADDARFYG
jgi:hypothetical protein